MAEITWKSILTKLVGGDHLSAEESEWFVDDLMQGNANPAAVGAVLATQQQLGLTADEVRGAAKAMVGHAIPLNVSGETTDIVGTGGDGAATVNLSSMGAVVAAASGVKVVKHGNRAASSKCGTADVQEALGANISQNPEKALDMLKKVGMCFLFAQKYHAAMKYVGPIRKELGFRTVFNILGPLTNPANPDFFLLGVYDAYLVEPVAKVLDKLGVKKAVVVHGMDCLDEVSPSAPTLVCELKNGYYRTTEIKPEDFGLTRGRKEELVGGTPEENAEITKGILSGKIQGTKRNAVLLNAGLAFYAAGAADTMAEGVKKAADLIDSGAAEKTMEAYIQVSNE